MRGKRPKRGGATVRRYCRICWCVVDVPAETPVSTPTICEMCKGQLALEDAS